MSKATFKIDTRLATLLSENYRSSELALKELVDNAWDADADNVSIFLPEPMSGGIITISDDGSGMTEAELTVEYLNIASNRRTRRGELTAVKKRKVKGRKGIGKFAGFMAANCMELETWARGIRSEFYLDKKALESHAHLSEMPLDVLAVDDITLEKGTKITLSGLHTHIAYPNPERLRQLLIQEYGREHDFNIFINGKALDIDDIQGVFTEVEPEVSGVGVAHLRFTVSDQKTGLRKPGITLRVQGRSIGEPSYFGLDQRDDFPPKLLKKIYGEVEVDGLADSTTADWGAIVENSEGYQELENIIQPILLEKVKEVYRQEMHLAQARLKRETQQRIQELPELKREYATKAIQKILDRFFQESPEKAEPIINVLLDAIERSDYRTVLEHINDAKHSEVAVFAEALDEFGLLEMSRMIEQTNNRLKFLDYLEELCGSPNTMEKDVHKAIERNLWVLGQTYSLFSSNITLRRQIEDYLNQTYIGDRADKRPDLMLSQNFYNEYLLIEFKKPSHNLRFSDYQQATQYRNDYRQNTMREKIEVWLIGGRRHEELLHVQDREPSVKIVLFSDLISTARHQLNWLINELANSH